MITSHVNISKEVSIHVSISTLESSSNCQPYSTISSVRMYAPFIPMFLLIAINLFTHIPLSFSEDDPRFSNCSTRLFNCGKLRNIEYPFWGNGRPEYCGLPELKLNCKEESASIEIHSQSYHVLDINQKQRPQTLQISTNVSWEGNCPSLFTNISLPGDLFTYSGNLYTNITLSYGCPSITRLRTTNKFNCSDTLNYFWLNSMGGIPEELSRCNNTIVVPVLQTLVQSFTTVQSTMEVIIKAGFPVEYTSHHEDCRKCRWSGGRCGYDLKASERICFCSSGSYRRRCPTTDANIPLKVGIGVGTGVGGVLISIVCFILYQRRKRSKFSNSSTLISRELSSNHSNIPDPEKGSIYFKTPIFTYKELDEATNHFDSKKELGDGGFGTVYHGKLRDGRVVAVKRLFEHNYKRVDQFMNEIAILSGLRHRNLVSLYGCTSRHSRELLLVYEYVPNGTVADHLHGDRATACQLTWPIRLSIAIESADALAYLHASQIIHRDVKTNNILLDNGFHVKVADFGLSRLFPENVTHVSTAPQGTPGYVDPEYYQCYQLNDKSDVYSFGVVLIELISSKPAVDIGRHRHEINLANMAVNKIQHQALHELVDLSLGFDSDYNVRDRITLVAELAFRCLQQEKEMRPCMIEVLETLRGIESEEYKKKKSEEIDTSADARLLKNSPLSPVSVTDKWASRSTTPNTSS